jgi:hypothetical protein
LKKLLSESANNPFRMKYTANNIGHEGCSSVSAIVTPGILRAMKKYPKYVGRLLVSAGIIRKRFSLRPLLLINSSFVPNFFIIQKPRNVNKKGIAIYKTRCMINSRLSPMVIQSGK